MPKPCARSRSAVFLPRLRSVRPLEVARVLAEAIDLSPERASLAVRTAWYPGDAPERVPFVDADAWLAVTLGCLPAFAVSVPSLREIRRRACRSMLVTTLARSNNNLSEASRLLDHSRKVLRDHLRREGLHPIPDIAGELLTNRTVARTGSAVTVYAGATLAGLRVLAPRADASDRVVLEDAATIIERMGRGLEPQPSDDGVGEK